MNEGGQSAHPQAFTRFHLTLESVKFPTLSVSGDLHNQMVQRGRKQGALPSCARKGWIFLVEGHDHTARPKAHRHSQKT